MTTPLTVLLAVDKFKGSLTSAEVARCLHDGLVAGSAPGRIETRTLALADGGDGSVDAALAAGFIPVEVHVTGPVGDPAVATIALDGDTAVIEVATTSGLQMLPVGTLAPLSSTSLGFGQAVRAAVERGARRVVLGLGGSAMTDGGAGLLSALGVRFVDATGRAFVPAGGTLAEIDRVDLSGLIALTGVELIAANDVQNPLLGAQGTAAIYAPQKGASPADVEFLDAGLAHLVRRMDDAGWPASAAAETPGTGSAGGLGFTAMLLGARMVSGADHFLDLLDFDAAVEGCDLVVTGEGKLDEQTLSGKLPLAVARRAGGVPVVAVVGHNALPVDRVPELPEHGIQRVHSLSSLTDRDSSADPQLSAQLLVEIGRRIAAGL